MKTHDNYTTGLTILKTINRLSTDKIQKIILFLRWKQWIT